MKKFIYFVDDNIRFFEEITKKHPKSLFDNPFLGFHKQMHEKYGICVQLNLFYEYENFNLSLMTADYKQEWKDNSDWLKLGFHSRSEFPDFPYACATYDEVANDYDLVMNEVKRFAGEECITNSYVTHWVTMSDMGIKAMMDRGAVMSTVTTGDKDHSPEIFSALSSGHRERALLKREGVSSPSVCVRNINGASGVPYVCNYNHLSDELTNRYMGKIKMYRDEKTGYYFNRPSLLTLNACKLKNIPARLNRICQNNDYAGFLIHEQYFYPDYFAYEPDYCEKIETAIKVMLENGFENVAMCDLIKYQN